MGCKVKEYNKNFIPKLTAKRLQYWQQPDKSEIIVDDSHALMSLDTFNRLQNLRYDYHNVYCDEGKMCRYNNIFYWFGYHKDPNKVSINYREIIIL
jgi:hypothetical protein